MQWITLVMLAVLFCLNKEHGMCMLVGLLSIIPHEYGHSLVARRMGNQIGDIFITPLGGMANVSIRPFDPRNELLVTLAGPVVNCVICLAATLALFVPWESQIYQSLLVCVAAVNLIIVLFNLLPIFPLDGGRILRASLAYFIREPRATKIACSVSMFMCVAMCSFGAFSGDLFMVMMATFIFFLSRVEYEMMCKAVAKRDSQD